MKVRLSQLIATIKASTAARLSCFASVTNTSVQLVSSNTGGITCVKLPADNILDYLDELSMCGIESKLISYRNDSGNFDFPDVFRLYCEENEDYE